MNNKVSGGQKFTCAIVDNGDLKCWGADGAGQLGDGGTIGVGVNTDTNAPSSTAIDLGTGRTAVAVSAGSYHACAILDNGELKCWGTIGKDSWVMVEVIWPYLRLHPRRSTSARAVRPSQWMREVVTPAPSLTTAT